MSAIIRLKKWCLSHKKSALRQKITLTELKRVKRRFRDYAFQIYCFSVFPVVKKLSGSSKNQEFENLENL